MFRREVELNENFEILNENLKSCNKKKILESLHFPSMKQ